MTPNRWTCRLLAAPMALAVAALAAAPAAAQCYSRSPYLSGSDICGTKTAVVDYDSHTASDAYFTAVGGVPLVIATTSNDLSVYDVSNPLTPNYLAAAHIPWDWVKIGGEGSHGIYNNHLRNIATTPGYRYALVMLGGYGWDFLDLNGRSTGFLGHGYMPTSLLSNPYQSAALFTIGTDVWAAAQALDQPSIDGSDYSIRLYKVGSTNNPSFTQGITPSTIGSGVVVPVGHAGDTPSNSQFSLSMAGMRLYPLAVGSKTFLIARSRGLSVSALAIVDVTNPNSPQVASWTSDATLATNSIAVNQDTGTIWAGDPQLARAYGYTVTFAGTLSGGQTVDWIPGAPRMGGVSVPSSAGDLLSVTAAGQIGYVSTAGSTPTVLPNGGADYSNPSRTCLNTGYTDTCSEVTVFTVAGHHYVARVLGWNHDIVSVSDACISTVPSPDFTVTGGSSAASCSGPVGYTQADTGFPGDTFTITDASGGVWDSAQLTIEQPLGTTISGFPMTIIPRQSVQFAPTISSAPVDYYVTLSILGGVPFSKTKVVSICDNPQAALAFSQGGAQALVGDSINMTAAATTGHPDLGYTFYVIPPGDQPAELSGSGATLASPYTVASTGTYTFGVVAKYSFTSAAASNCSGFLPGIFLGPAYNSCATLDVSVQNGTASFQVEQPSGSFKADHTTAGSINIAQPVILRFLGRIAGTYTPYFQWSIPNVSPSQLTCSYTASPYKDSTCTIPAGALTAGSPAAWNLSVGVCNGGGLGSPPAPCTTTVDTVAALPVTVTPTQNSWAFTVSPGTASIGQTVTITLQNVIPSDGSVYNNLVFDLGGGTTCDGRTQITYPCNGIFGAQCVSGATTTFNFGSADGGHTRTITGTGNLNGGGTVPANGQQSVNVTSSGTCPCPTVTTSVGGPTSAQVGQQVTFTATASAPGYSITGYSWTFGDGGTGTGSSVTHTYTSANTYTVRVTATSSCGNTGSDTMAIVIGGGGGGGGLTITPNPGTANPGQNVTFTFSPKITTPGDSLTFNFGDGTVQTASYSPICQQFGGCNTITYAYTTPGVYTVTASGVANGSSVSGSTSVTVRNTCTATSPPGTGFTWAPPQPKVGQAVQFTDQSTGSPTSWLWDFGTGASGMSLGQVTTLAAGTLTIGFSPLSPTAGQKVTFAFSPALTLSGDTLTFNFGDGTVQPTSYNASICGTSGCGKITHTYTSGGTFTVSASGIAGGGSVSGSTSITIGGSGGAGALAIAASPSTATVGQTVTFTFAPSLTQSGDAVLFSFGDTSTSTVSYPSCGIACNVVTHAYTAVGTYGVTGTGTAGGAAVAGGTAVSVVTGGGVGTSTLQNPSFTYTTAGTYTVTLTATNCKGSTPLQKQITVLPLCSQTAVPAANFTWGPTGALAGFPEQQQPYAGQQVTLTDASTNSPTSWSWYDFQELMLQPTTVTVPTFTATWTLAGDKNVRMKATNCFGTSAEVLNVVHIYPDVRHVNADFSWAPDPINTGAAVTFTAITGSANGDPDTFVWTFDDTKTPVTGNPVAHTFSCAGNHKVTLTSSRSDYSGATAKVTKLLAVNGTLCGPESVMTVDNAKLNGLNGTSWRTDVRIFNPASSTSAITLQILPVNQDNTKPFTAGPYNVPAKGTLVLNDILGWVAQTLGASFTKTALRVMYDNDQQEAPMVIGRTYTPSPGGGTYGQFTPGISVYPGTTVTPVWLTGLRNNGQQTGFRTNYSLLNLLGDSYAGNINVTLYDVTGTARKTVTLGMGPSGYLQDSIANLFGSGYTTVGTFSLRLDIPPGEDIQAYASVVDNQTGAPVLIPAGPPPTSPIYLPAVAHTSGKNGTVWRSDMQLTNPDTVTHTWNVTYLPKASDNLSVQQRQITMSSQQSTLMADALGWVFSGILPDATNTSGVLKITPADGSDVFPVVQARSFNQTANGTFGQNITPFTADSGLAADSAETRLLLTGMSTTDTGFRTNIGFVNLSETSSVNFAVYFYDEAGNLLNPVGTDSNPIPYTFALGVGGWDQDQLENRFRNAFGITLPANLRAVSAEIFVTGGGPGTVYATVIDNLTGDPVFIPAQLAP